MIIELIQIIENDDERSAVNEIFQKYFPKMQSVAYTILNNRQDAEDAAMEAMKYICEHSEIFVDYKNKKTISLIFICVRSKSINIYRKNQRKSEVFTYTDDLDIDYGEYFEEDSSLFDISVTEENKNYLSKAIDELDDMYKIPILLKYNHQMKNKDIAKVLNIDTNTVNGRIFRAKRLLKEKIQQQGGIM